MFGLVVEVSGLREEPSESKRDSDRLTPESKVLLARGTEVYELKTTRGSLMGSLQCVKARTSRTRGT